MGEPLEASVTVEEVIGVVATKRVPLAPELAGYLALEIAEAPPAQGAEIDPRQVYVGEEGAVAIVRPRGAEATGDAEASIRALLGRLLEVGGSQTPALGAAARKASGAGLPALVEELEAALIPVNRGAGRRALARLAREVKRVTLGVGRNALKSGTTEAQPASGATAAPATAPPAKPAPAAAAFEPEEVTTSALQQPPSLSDMPTVGLTRADIDRAQGKKPRDSVDSLLENFEVSGQKEEKALSRDLKAMAGLDPTPPPPDVQRPADESDVDELLGSSAAPPAATSDSDRPPTRPDAPAARRSQKVHVAPTPPRAPASSYGAERSLPTGPASLSRITSLAEVRTKRRRSVVPLVAVIVLVGVAAAFLWTLKPGFFTGRTPEKIAEEQRLAAEREKERQAAAANQTPCKAAVLVSGAPEGSEILVRAGVAPVDVERMPVGPRLEFVATAEGWAPKRAVVPQGAAWEKGADGKPRYEVALQLDKSRRPGAVDPWPPAEPGSEVGGKGDPGTVHIVATPKGAEVWLVVGLGPDARIDELVRCDSDAELFVAGPTSLRKRISVRSGEFAPDPQEKGNVRVARVTVPKK